MWLRSTLRALARTPALSVGAVVTLALAMGAAGSVFVVADGQLIRPLAVSEPARLMSIAAIRAADGKTLDVSVPEFADWQQRSTSFASIAGYGAADVSVRAGTAAPLPASAAIVTPAFFETLGAMPAAGAWLPAADDGRAVVVISDALWNRVFDRSPGAIGASIQINGEPFAIAGVARADFPLPAETPDVWIPLRTFLRTAPDQWNMRGYRSLALVGRLKPDVDPARASAEAARTAADLAAAFPRFDRGLGAAVERLNTTLRRQPRRAMTPVIIAAAFLFLTACVNVAALQMARASRCAGQFALRSALGASRRRLIAEAFVESALITAAGAALAAGIAAAIVKARVIEIALSAARGGAPSVGHIALFSAGTFLFACLLCGTWTAVEAARSSRPLANARTTSGPAVRRWHSALAIGQIAASMMVLTGGLLLARSLQHLLHVDIGVRHPDALAAQVDLSSAGIADAAAPAFVARALERIRTEPGVSSAGVMTSLPPDIARMTTTMPAANAAGGDRDLNVAMIAIDGDPLTVLGLTVESGRAFDARDSAAGDRVALLSRTAAVALFGDADPIGRTVPVGRAASGRRVVGVVSDVRYTGLEHGADGAVYLPFSQQPFGTVYFVLRSASVSAAAALPAALREVEPGLAVHEAASLADLALRSTAAPRSRSAIVLGFAALTVALTSIGLFGVMSFSVSERRRELGVRAALGARRASLLSMLAAESARMVVPGLTLGWLGAWLMGRAVESLLFGVSAADAWSFGIAAAAVLTAAMAACAVPAASASGIDPAIALKTQ